MKKENRPQELGGLFPFQGKNALVTGSTKGLGREIALALAHQGASLVLADIVAPDDTAAAIDRIGSRVLTIETDVSEESSVRNLVREAVAGWGRLDLLINNAGISQTRFEPSEQAPMEEWDRILEVNLRGTYLCCQQVGRHMIEKGGGIIINIASTAGLIGIPRAAAYCASKAGVISLTKSLAIEWAKYNIRVNAVAPHYIETDLTRGLRDSEKVYKGIIRQIPLKRFSRPEELIGTILLLGSSASSYITGTVITVDGGFLA